MDKVFKNIMSVHDADEGSFQIDWETENASGSFVIDLTNNSTKWQSFFPSTAMGRKLNLRIYKNDAYDFKIKELQGLYTPMPAFM